MDIPAVVILIVAALGLAIGSFLNVVAHRVPLGLSLAHPPSRCPSCETPIRPTDNVPVLGWLRLRGRCRSCAAPIPARYPLVEAGTAVLWVLAVLTAQDAVSAVLHVLLVTALVPLTIIDLEHRRLPDGITLPAAAVAVLAGTALDPGGEVVRLLSGLGAAVFLGVPALLHPRGMGMGDVKLVGVMGLCLGPAVGVAVLAGLLLGSVVGVVLASRSSEGRKLAVPFGPFLAAGGVLAILAGGPILALYLDRL